LLVTLHCDNRSQRNDSSSTLQLSNCRKFVSSDDATLTACVMQSLVDAFNAYGVKNAIIVMIVQPGEKNAFDQRMLEYGTASAYTIVVGLRR
jgi:hypothetical protein